MLQYIAACTGTLLALAGAARSADLKHPDWHPGGNKLIAEGSCHGNIGLYLVDLADDHVRLLYDSNYVDGYPRWYPDGHRIAFHQIDKQRMARLFVARVSADDKIISIERLTTGPFDIEPAPSPDNQRIAYSSAGESGQDIAVLNSETNEQRTWRTAAAENLPSWHPDGQSILYHTRSGGNTQILLHSLQTDETRRLTDSDGPNTVGHLNAEGTQLVFSSERDGDREIYMKELDTGQETRLTTRAGRDGYPRFSPDGKRIAYHRANTDGSTSLRILKPDSGETQDIACPVAQS